MARLFNGIVSSLLVSGLLTNDEDEDKAVPSIIRQYHSTETEKRYILIVRFEMSVFPLVEKYESDTSISDALSHGYYPWRRILK